MSEKISVIVPIYKVEQYLDRCVKSIVEQSYPNLEIILVDDGSPDRCGAMCDEWATKDQRITVIHKENGGLSDARNAGIRIATGEYISFVDSDDWLHKDTLIVLYSCLQKNSLDIVECSALSTSKVIEDKAVDSHVIEVRVFNDETAMEALIGESPLKQTVWNKLYRTELIKDILFEYGRIHEDEFWTYQVFAKANRIGFIDLELYYYFQREDSIMGQMFSPKRLDAIEGRYRRCKLVEKKYPRLAGKAKENLMFLIIYYGQLALMSETEQKNIFFKQFKRYVNEMRLNDDEKRNLSIIHKIWLYGSRWNLPLICKIRNWLRINVNSRKC